MVRGVLRWNGGTTGGARVSQIAQVTAGTELLPIMLRVQPVLPVVRCVPVVVTTTHASRMLSGGLAQPWAHTDLLLTQRMPRPACEVCWGSRVTDLLVSVIQVVPGCASSATDLLWCENLLLWAAVDAEVTSDCPDWLGCWLR